MSTPFIGEIIMFAGNFPPRGWAFCQGQLLSIAQNTALFSILGTTYGGDGQTTFALPDLRGRVPIHPGQGPGLPSHSLGEQGGEPTHTLITTEMPAHSHAAQASGVSAGGNSGSPGGGTWASSTARDNIYSNAAPNAPMATNNLTVGNTGGSQPHNNMQPYLGINFIIALEGIFPSRN
jgi:microcystin-dependent protein